MRTAILYGLVVVLTAAVVQGAGAEDVKARYAERLGRLSNVMVTYDVNNIIPEDEAARLIEFAEKRSGGANRSVRRIEVRGAATERRLCLLVNLARYEMKMEVPEIKMPDPREGMVTILRDEPSSVVTVLTGPVTEVLGGFRRDTKFAGYVEKGSHPDDDAIDQSLGLRHGLFRVDSRLLEHVKAAMLADGMAELRFACPGGGYDRWVLDPGKGYAPVIQESIGADDVVWSRTQMSDWKQVGGTWLPYVAKEEQLWTDPNGVQRVTGIVLYTVKSFQVNSPDNKPSLYKMAWPEGTLVTDRDDGKMYVAEGGQLKPADANTPGFRPK